MNKSGLLRHWRFRIHRVQIGHYEAGRIFERRHFWLGVPAVVISTIVGTAVFASLAESAQDGSLLWMKIVVGLLSVTAGVLVSLQTFLRYAEQAESHKNAGARYTHLKHRLELLAAMPPAGDDDLKAELNSIETEWEKVREESPNLPTRVWIRVMKELTMEKDFESHPEFGERA